MSQAETKAKPFCRGMCCRNRNTQRLVLLWHVLPEISLANMSHLAAEGGKQRQAASGSAATDTGTGTATAAGKDADTNTYTMPSRNCLGLSSSVTGSSRQARAGRGGNKKGGGACLVIVDVCAVVVVAGGWRCLAWLGPCDTNASNYCHMSSLSRCLAVKVCAT